MVILIIIAAVARRPAAPTVPAITDEVAESSSLTPTPPTESSPASSPVSGPSSVAFGTPKKSAHFESSTPAHGTTLPAPPTNVAIDVNFDLASKSSISIMSGGKEYGTGSTSVDTNKLAMRRVMDPSAPDGLYTVTYRACWPDKTCHDGHFQFAIDRTKTSAALDLRGQSAVTVNLKDIVFVPPTIRIRRGTTVKWVNDDTVEHYVNTDAHPSHTYFPTQNSRSLKKGDTFSVAFADPGAYPYHCSAHADTMRGLILVE